MSKGYTGVILRVDLSKKKTEKLTLDSEFYRTYMGGGAIGAYFLLNDLTGPIDAFDAKNIITIAPSITTGSNVSGVSRCSAVAISPLTGAVGEGQAGGAIGPMIKRAGYDAVVVTGKAKKLSYLYVDSKTVEIRDARHFCEKTISMRMKQDLSEDLACGFSPCPGQN